MIQVTPSSLVGRKEQLTYLINLIFVFIGVFFLARDYFLDYLEHDGWYPGTVRQLELIFLGVLNIVLIKMKMIKIAKWITSTELMFIFFVTPIFVTLGYWDMYYINALLLPVIVVIPGMVFHAREDKNSILILFVIALASNFLCEYIIFEYKGDVLPSERELYHSHSGLLSWAKIFTSLFIYLNITRLFQQNETFEATIVTANTELNTRNQLINSQKEKIEEQNSALRKSEEELKKLDVAKSHFFANISHEFRTPLTLILGPLSEQIANASVADREQFVVMKRSATRLLNLVNQLLDLSKLESGSLELHASYADISIFLQRIASQFSSIAESKGMEFKFEAPPAISFWFDGDKVEKIVTNLLSNAFKFTPAGGVVSLVLITDSSDSQFEEGCARIEISDSGIGIEEDNVEKIFDRFYQVNDSSRREYEGTGIGLALVKELVEVHHGSIQVVSRAGQGSVFIVRLPLGKFHLLPKEIGESNGYSVDDGVFAHLDGAKSSPHLIQKVKEEKPHVLVVEDNIDLQRYLELSLKEEYRVSFAANGEEGGVQALAEQPDLVVSDLMMPKVDGMTLVKQIKTDEKTSHIPVILLTAKVDFNTKLEGIETGADDYIAKPFEMTELKARIHNLIEGRRKLREKFSTIRDFKPPDIKAESLDDKFLRKVLTSIDNHIPDEQFGVDNLAEDVAMSNIQLYRKLKALTGKTPNDLIRNIRLDRANSLLEQNAGNVSEIAYQVGFRNLSYFTKCFKEKFGMNPREVRHN